ncbi:MAG: hypothetical protein HY717_20335 [Planctomycetes bacterium]|nr:hypothetical protein [Planctomycetota bacterium]
MSLAFDIIKSLPLAELRRLIAIKENQRPIENLLEKRDRLLEEARLIQNQIDDLIDLGAGRSRKKRKGPSVKALCIEALDGVKGGMSAAEVKNAILARYPYRNTRTFYNQVFIALTRSQTFKKLRNGKFLYVGSSRDD